MEHIFIINELKECSVEYFLNQLNINKTKNKMSEITLKCFKEPQKAKNISVGNSYTGILINSDDTQVDSYDEAEYFLCTNKSGVEAKYKISLFEKPTPMLRTMEEIINSIEVIETDVHIPNTNGEPIILSPFGTLYLIEGGVNCSCGIRTRDGISKLYEELSNLDFSDIENMCSNFDDHAFVVALFKAIVIASVKNHMNAMTLFSTTEDVSDVCSIMDELVQENNGARLGPLLNPNSGNNIIAWLIPSGYIGSDF